MEAVVAFAFGVPATLWSNRTLATIATAESKRLGRVPVFTQLDIQLKDKSVPVVYCQEIPGEPPPTLRIAREAVRWAMRNRVTVLHVAAARPHIRRVIRDLTWAVREARVGIVITLCDGVFDYPVEKWFMSDSTQPRVRSAKNWNSRERILRFMPMSVYKRVAG